jgi:hypothetical protein
VADQAHPPAATGRQVHAERNGTKQEGYATGQCRHGRLHPQIFIRAYATAKACYGALFLRLYYEKSCTLGKNSIGVRPRLTK